MDCFLQPSALLVEVQPKHGCSFPRLESNAIPTIIAIYKLTPPAVCLRVEHRELCPATLARIANVDHERRATSRVAACRAPVVVLRVVAGHVIALSPESLDECIARPSLECESTGFDALYKRRTRDERFIGFANFVVGRLNAAMKDSARLPFVFADSILLAGLHCELVANGLSHLSSISASASSPVRKPSMYITNGFAEKTCTS